MLPLRVIKYLLQEFEKRRERKVGKLIIAKYSEIWDDLVGVRLGADTYKEKHHQISSEMLM